MDKCRTILIVSFTEYFSCLVIDVKVTQYTSKESSKSGISCLPFQRETTPIEVSASLMYEVLLKRGHSYKTETTLTGKS